ncbi:MAG: AAA family ATPase [Pirellulales bacterium]
MTSNPSVIVLAGPNGAGKTTAAPALLPNVLGVIEFVNADTIAQGLAAFGPERVALEAAGIMLTRLHELASLRRSFAFETTLASRSLAPWLAKLTCTGYQFQLVFLWLPGEEIAVARVTDRARMGGHDVPAETVRRRYHAGLRNFFSLYQPLANAWAMYDNSEMARMRLIASGEMNHVRQIGNESVWRQIQQEYSIGHRK